MENIFFVLLCIPFLYLNSLIVVSDIQKKIIPNKYLLYLLLLFPLFSVGLFTFQQIDIGSILLQSIFTLFVAFGLYFFGLWCAGDAKYLFILSLFLGNIGILPFIGNIALLILVYLSIYCIYFYAYKLPFNRHYSKYIYTNIVRDIKEKTHTFLKTGSQGLVFSDIIKKVSLFFLLFLTLFVSLRLIRMYVINEYLPGNASLHQVVGETLSSYLPIFGTVAFILLVIIAKILYGYVRMYSFALLKFVGYKGNSPEPIDIIYTFIAFFTLGIYILYEFSISPEYISHKLALIFSVYLGFFVFFIFARYAYIVTFQIGELTYTPFSKLKEGEIVDKPYLVRLFGNQSSPHTAESLKFIKEFDNPIDKDTCKKIQQIFRKINAYHKKQKVEGFNDFIFVKTLNTFSLGGYIFGGFLVTYIFGNTLLQYIALFFSHLTQTLLR